MAVIFLRARLCFIHSLSSSTSTLSLFSRDKRAGSTSVNITSGPRERDSFLPVKLSPVQKEGEGRERFRGRREKGLRGPPPSPLFVEGDRPSVTRH